MNERHWNSLLDIAFIIVAAIVLYVATVVREDYVEEQNAYIKLQQSSWSCARQKPAEVTVSGVSQAVSACTLYVRNMD